MSNYKATLQPCPNCGSSDALVINSNDSTFCYSCRKYTHASARELLEDDEKEDEEVRRIRHSNVDPSQLQVGYSMGLPERGISKETCEAYGVTVKNGVHIYPYHDEYGELVAQKTRSKDAGDRKRFATLGKWKDITRFGQNNFGKGGKFVTLCEGELDALAAYEMLGSKWPVVSICNGASSVEKDIERSFDYLMSYDKIVICFDSDKPGKAAAKKAAELLSSKSRVVNLKLKDANEYLLAHKQQEFKDTWWSADDYTPEGVVAGTSLWDVLKSGPTKTAVDYPYSDLNRMTYGIRMGELITVCAGTGIGKSSFLREAIKFIFDNTNDNIGMMFMEENVRSTAEAMMSLDLSTPLHLPHTKYTADDDEYKQSFEKTIGSGRYYFFDHFGSNTIEEIMGRIRYFVKVQKCRYVILDHISIIVSSQQHASDERKTIDECMTKLRMLVQELDFCLFMVSHLRRPIQGSHEEGLNTSLSDLRGSASIGQLSDIVLGLERDGQSDDLEKRHTTYVRVIKNRFSGLTGLCAKLYYDSTTGRIIERTIDLKPEKDDDDCL